MASQKNFSIKNGLTVAGTERISSSGDITGSHFGSFSGTSTTRSAGTNNTQLATTAFVTGAISDLVDSSPATLNTLNELAAALGDDANFSTTVTNSIATKLPLAGGTMTGALNMGSQLLTNVGANITFSTSVDGAINFPSTGYINFDSDNNSGGEDLIFGANRTAGSGGNEYFRITHGGDISVGSDHGGFSGWRVLNLRGGSSGGMLNVEASDGTRSATFAGQHPGIRYQTHTTGGYHRFETSLASNAFYIQDSGNVGMGPSNPLSRLHISGNSDSGDAECTLTIDDEDTTSGSMVPAIQFRGNGNNLARIRANDQQGLLISGSSGNADDIVVQEGKVGMGTNSPAATLDVQESGITVTNNQAFVANFIGDGYGTGQVCVADSATLAANVGGEIQFGGKYSGNNLTEWASVGGYKENATSGQYGGYFAIKTRANGGSQTERMRITSTGVVQTTTTGSGDGYDIIARSTDGGDTGLELTRNGVVGFGIAVRGSADDYADFQVNNGGTPGYTETGKLRIYSSGNISIPGTALWSSGVGNTFGTTGNHYMIRSANSVGNESIIISNTTSGGSLGILQYRISGGVQGQYLIGQSSSGITFTGSSDYRLKENVSTIAESSLDKINQLRLVSYNWNDLSDMPTDTTEIGVIAHEIEEVFPEFVDGEKDAVYTQEELDARGDPETTNEEVGDIKPQTVSLVNKDMIVHILKAMQELKTELDAAKARITELEG